MKSSSRVIILTGLSGSGKTVALRALEDAGYFCIDNLPLPLLPNLLEISKDSKLLRNIAVESISGKRGFSEILKKRYSI